MKWKEPCASKSVLILAMLTIACLMVFVNKAFHMDDPLFIWTARHIQSDPADFYGFNVNWDKQERPMPQVTQNPPLAAYYLALVARLAGWGERPLHLGFLLPAVAAAVGTWFLAGRFCAHPFAAALLTVVAPVFQLASAGVMCDMLMLALWIWGMFFWLRGLERNSQLELALAGLLIAACSLTKYFGMCLVPLLLVYSWLAQRRLGRSADGPRPQRLLLVYLWLAGRRLGRWLVFLCLPIFVLAIYQWITQRLYGRGLLFSAADYATHLRVGGGLFSKTLVGLAFSGGCIFTILAAAPLAWGKRGVAVLLAGLIAAAGVVLTVNKFGNFSIVGGGHVKWLLVVQMALFTVGGMALLVLAVADLLNTAKKELDPASVLLALWTFGTFFFACAVNWTVAGRNILPMVPAASLLLVRRLELGASGGGTDKIAPEVGTARRAVHMLRTSGGGPDKMRYLWWPLGISLTVAMIVGWADYKLAGSARMAASAISRAFVSPSTKLAFEGHWGFQYYMEQLGAEPLSGQNMRLTSNEVIVVPLGNSFLFPLPRDRVEALPEYRVQAARLISIMSVAAGAGFYSDGWGPAPFVLGHCPPEQYVIFRVRN